MAEESELATMRAQVYKDPRPASYFDRFHARARTREPDWVYSAGRMLTTLYSWAFFRLRGVAAEKVPPQAAVILAPNHFSSMDHFFLGVSILHKLHFKPKFQPFLRQMLW